MTHDDLSPLSPLRVAVLGLGRMGAAMADRLSQRGYDVVGWSRSGRGPDGVTTADGPAAAAARADVVVLCLFDGPACTDVVRGLAGRLRPGAIVVNTSTVAPAEAVALAEEVRAGGGRYLHTPVMGSVPAVRAGTLKLLVGGDGRDDVADLLSALGEVVPCGGVADAAALKLLANGVLGSSLVALADARRRGAELGVEPSTAWEVLERTALGGLVSAKRDRLARADFAGADFTVAALAKDLALLAAAAPSAVGLRDRVAAALDHGVPPDADVAALVVAERPGGTRQHLEHGLSLAPGVDAPPEVLAPLRSYVAGHATGDPSYHREAFLPTAHIEGIRDGGFVSWTLDDYCGLFAGEPAPDEADRRRRVDDVTVRGTVATAAMTLHHGSALFRDLFLLVQTADGWRIANKVYDKA